MKYFKVNDCSNCPFLSEEYDYDRSDEPFYQCMLNRYSSRDYLNNTVIPVYSQTLEHEMEDEDGISYIDYETEYSPIHPIWCPLKTEGVIVEIETEGTIDF